MNVEQPETFVMIESIVYKSNGFAIIMKVFISFRSVATLAPYLTAISKAFPSFPEILMAR